MLAHHLLEQVAAHKEYHGDMENPAAENNRANHFAGAQASTQEHLPEGIQYSIGQLGKQLADSTKVTQQSNTNPANIFQQCLQQFTQGTSQAAARPTNTSLQDTEAEKRLTQLAGTSAAVAIGAEAASELASGTPRNAS